MSQLDDILAAVGAAPALPGAKCRGRHHLFDPAVPGEDPDNVTARHAQALGLCSHCPALDKCRDWLDSLPPSRRPFGVIAGNVRQP
jgi:hypothetical protein